MKKRTFTSEEKTRMVLEVLREEKELSVVAAENEVNPNQLRRWRAEFLENASIAFEVKENAKTMKKALAEKEEKLAEAQKTIGRLTMELDFSMKINKDYRERGYLRRS